MRRVAVRLCGTAVLFMALAMGGRAARADAVLQGIGLGVGIGAAVPSGQVFDGGSLKNVKPNFGWGFYVNIPLIATFQLMPHAEVYNVSPNVTATDIGLAFKFVIPTPIVRPYFAFAVGDTILFTQHVNVGGIVGAMMHVFANIDAFVEVRYVAVLNNTAEVKDVRTVHAVAGGIFRF